jgi:hypothetical protein
MKIPDEDTAVENIMANDVIEKQKETDEDDSGVSDDESFYSTDEEIENLKRFLQDMNTSDNSEIVVEQAKRAKNVYVSNVVHKFLRQSTSDGDICAEGILNIFKTNNDDDGSRLVFVKQKRRPSLPSSEKPSPSRLLESILSSTGINYTPRLKNFFLPVTKQQIAAYTPELVKAVRKGDVEAVRELYLQGAPLQACNRFHESILHIIARRGHAELLDFLLHDAGLDIRVRCDSGRTPLHDACWTGQPNFETVRIILEECPDLLLIKDNRNFTPLDYVPKECYEMWCDFLETNRELLLPRAL